jgi:RNA polymerase sigma-70 factor, ECF subfamily
MASPSPTAAEPDDGSRSGVREREDTPIERHTFDSLYEDYAAFVYRSIRRLGVVESAADDVFQDVFVVVHRRLDDFEQRSSPRTWLFGILLRVVRNHKRSLGRKRHEGGEHAAAVIDRAPASTRDEPEARTQRAQAVAMLHDVLDTLDDDKRAIFVMAELEQMSGAAIARATGLKQSTVYARLRVARDDFNQAVTRLAAHRNWRNR